jgi:hypothetical protein
MTAVELLVEKLTPMNWTKEYMQEYYKDAIQQAKEMEKKEKHAEYMRGWKDGYVKNETYKNTKE